MTVDERALLALPTEPGLCPESPDSPVIITRQLVFWKKGGYCTAVLRRMSGSPGQLVGANPWLSNVSLESGERQAILASGKIIQHPRQAFRATLNLQMMDYFARQTAVQEVGINGLKRLQSARVTIVGAGGVGSAAAYFLASQGIGHLKLIDQDIVEESNLHRLLGMDHEDLHVPKAEALARKLNNRHPWTRIEAVVDTLRPGNTRDLLHRTDLIVDGTDNFRSRYVLNKFAAENSIPYLFTSAIANQGHLSMFNSPATPCLECIIQDSGYTSAESCETLGVNPTTVGIVGTLAAAEAVKRILGLPSNLLGHLLTIDLAGPDFLSTPLKKRDDCPVCNGSSSQPAHRDSVVMLCGDNVANVLPEKEIEIDLQSLNGKISRESIVASSASVFVYTRQTHKVSVFQTGRLLIGNVQTEETARQVASEVWKEIL